MGQSPSHGSSDINGPLSFVVVQLGRELSSTGFSRVCSSNISESAAFSTCPFNIPSSEGIIFSSVTVPCIVPIRAARPRKNHIPIIIAINATPPMTPPAIVPAWGPDEGLSLVDSGVAIRDVVKDDEYILAVVDAAVVRTELGTT